MGLFCCKIHHKPSASFRRQSSRNRIILKLNRIATALLLSFATIAMAQAPEVKVSAKATAAGTAKTPIKAEITIVIPEGFHIYGPKVETGIPTKVSWAGAKGYTITATYPKTEKIDSPDGPVDTYEGKVVIPVTITAPKKVKGKVDLKFEVTTQACDETTCFRPSTVTVSAKGTIK